MPNSPSPSDVDGVFALLKDAYGSLEVIMEPTSNGTWFKWLEAQCTNTGKAIISRHHSPNLDHFTKGTPLKLHMQHRQSFTTPQRHWCNLISTLTRVQAYSTCPRMLVLGALQFISEGMFHGFKWRELVSAMHYMATKESSPFRLQWRIIALYLGKRARSI